MSAGIDVTKQAVLQPSQLLLDGLLNKHIPLNGIIEDIIPQHMDLELYSYSKSSLPIDPLISALGGA